MARSEYVWGIDIGKCALKALRCRLSADPRKLTAEAVDYIEYPMMLTQPEADPVELVRAALETFTGRNTLKGDRIAVSVLGQSGLSKFIKLPPIEAKKIGNIVQYEARQQIPFPLEQVVWDWQRLAGGMEESGFVLEAEVALFAMKREQAFKALDPLIQAGIEVDVLQLSPIALANMVMFDELPDPSSLDPDKPPSSIVLVSTGVDSTDLVITNGLKIWQRSMPIGGATFTKAIVRGMKLTFAKAEHLKRNAVRAEDPKLVFKEMRPVFNDFAGELQRSLNYFTGADRTATIGKVLLLGNATKLRGLSDFVAKQLKLDVQRLETFRGLEGAAVLANPLFKDNRLSFGTAYGLALQAAGKAPLRTNLLPPEIVRERLIESKKPWAVGAMVGLLIAAVLSFATTFLAWTSFSPLLYSQAFKDADRVNLQSREAIASWAEVQKKHTDAILQQQFLLNVENRRFQMMDMLRAVNSLLPQDPPGNASAELADRKELHIDKMDCEYFPDLARWFSSVEQAWTQTHPTDGAASEMTAGDGSAPVEPAAAVNANAPEGLPTDGLPAGAPAMRGPKGPGWVIELTGHHFHNEDHHKPNQTAQFVRSTIVKGLLAGEPEEGSEEVQVSAGPLAGKRVTVAGIGIGFPVIISSSPVNVVSIVSEEIKSAALPSGVTPDKPPDLKLKRYDFVLQFCWQPTTPGALKPPPPPAVFGEEAP